MAHSTRGKSVDRSSPWSESKWDSGRGLWYSERLSPSGEPEYFYHQDSTAPNDDTIPRGLTFGAADTSGTEAYQDSAQFSPPSTLSAGTSYAPTDSYTTSNSNPSWYNSGSPYSSAPQYGSESADTVAGMSTAFYNMNLNTIPEREHLQPANPQQNVKNIYKAPGSPPYETLDPRYRVVDEKSQRDFWKVGRVFMMLWTEPANDTPRVPEGGGTRNGSHFSTTWLKGTAYSEIRRFVVIAEGYGNSICSPIQTYSGQATLKPNLPDPQQHAIIYTSEYPPQEHSYTYNGTSYREELSKDPIKVRREQKGPEGNLDPLSRINYSKIYTVENYVRVLNIGMVERDWLPTLKRNSLIQRNSPVEKPRNHTSRSSSSHHHKGNKGKGRR